MKSYSFNFIGALSHSTAAPKHLCATHSREVTCIERKLSLLMLKGIVSLLIDECAITRKAIFFNF